LVLFGPSKNEARKRSISESYAEHPIAKVDLKPMTLHEEIKKLKETVQNRDDEIHKLKVSGRGFFEMICRRIVF
jgi:hypothetical protein